MLFKQLVRKAYNILLKIKYAKFIFEYLKLSRLDIQKRHSMSWADWYPCLTDNTAKTGFDYHYVYHTAWAARVLYEIRPQKHVDISSSLYFAAIVSSFVPLEFYDYRPANLNLSNINTGSADLVALQFADNSLESLSCMHVVEHIGLGRYGDQIDPEGDLKAIAELQRVLKPGGSLLFVVPVGKPKIMFNAHRIYSYDQILEYFAGFTLVEFALVPDDAVDKGLMRYATKEMSDQQNYGCGCFWFKK
jgi:Methylase involved in ubiquinone/menaquinone biosynthesis